MLIRVVIIGLLLGSSLSGLGQLQTLPRRLVLCLDGVSWRDVKALQEGVVTDQRGRSRNVSAFQDGYFPASRLVSTFPSSSDVAWTEMFGNAPLPGYQRSYFDLSANKVIVQNGVTTTMEYESQMHWQVASGWHRALGFVAPVHEFKREVRLLLDDFMLHSAGIETYYAMLRTTDDAQHLGGDIFSMLHLLDKHLQDLQGQYRARTGHDLEILILSDHGNNHAGRGKRLPILRFLKEAGYHISTSIHDSHDVALPSAGIQTWVGIYSAPDETPKLASRLVGLDGVDLITSRIPGRTNDFVVCNHKGARAVIICDPIRERYRYVMLSGDPLEYAPVIESLRRNKALDEEGFASVEDWRAATMQLRYPVALERITRGLTAVTRNPATILLSLDNGYVHAGFFVFHGSRFVTFGGTHGGLDSLNSNGVILSNFTPTSDTTTPQLARQFACFPGRNQTILQAKAGHQ